MCPVPRPSARPFCGGVPRRAAPPRSDAAAGSRTPETKKPRGVTTARDSSAYWPSAARFSSTKRKIVNGVQVEMEVIAPVGREKPVYPAPGHLRGALARDPSACLTAVEVVSSVPTQKRTSTRSGAEAGPALDRLHRRMASELEALHELVKKAELICSKSKRTLAAEPRMEAGDKTPSAKKRKVSPLPEQNQKQSKAPPRMSADERKQLAGRMASLVTVPDDFAEFLQKRLGGDAEDFEIDFHSAEDSVLFELQAWLDKLAAEERPKAEAVAPKEEQDYVAMEIDSKA
ncbi:unnamed protein product [Urochloa humidicola]